MAHQDVLDAEYRAKHSLDRDFQRKAEEVCERAMECDERSDERGLSLCTKELAGSRGRGKRALPGVKLADGQQARDEAEPAVEGSVSAGRGG